MCDVQTFQSVDSPCLKFLECNFCCGRQDVEIEPMVILLLLKLCICELPLLVVEVGTSLGIDARVIVSDHDVGFVHFFCCVVGLRAFQCW